MNANIKSFDAVKLAAVESHNYRRINDDHVAALAESIRLVGIRTPITLAQAQDSGRLYVVSGHHRVEAIKKLMAEVNGFNLQVPVIIEQIESASSLETRAKTLDAVVANSCSYSGAIDKALAARALSDKGDRVDVIARTMGVSERTARNYLDLANLPSEVLSEIYRHERVSGSLAENFLYKIAAAFKRDPKDFDISRYLSPKRPQLKERTNEKPDTTNSAEDKKRGRASSVNTPDQMINVSQSDLLEAAARAGIDEKSAKGLLKALGAL